MILNFLFAVALAGAADCVDCKKAADRTPLDSSVQGLAVEIVRHRSNQKPWWAASDQQILGAHCKTRHRLTDQEVEQALAKLEQNSSPKISKNVFGIELKNENARMVELLEMLLKMKPALNSDAPSVDQKTFSSSCHSVSCVLDDQAIFPQRIGKKLMVLIGKYGLNGSHHAAANASAWTAGELNDVFAAVQDYPRSVFPLTQDKQIVHFLRDSSAQTDDETLANSRIYVFNQWNRFSSSQRQATIFHELAHYISDDQKPQLDNHPRWLALSQWSKKTVRESGVDKEIYATDQKDEIISKYGEETPYEDFAESAVAYRYHAQTFKNFSPKKYQFMREVVFDGVEYTSNAECTKERQSSNSTQISEKVVQKIEKNSIAQEHSQRAVLDCLDSWSKALDRGTGRIDQQFLRNSDGCFQNSLAASLSRAEISNSQFQFADVSEPRTLNRVRIEKLSLEKANEIHQQSAQALQNAMQQMIVFHDADNDYLFRGVQNDATPNEFCHLWARYAYQSAEKSSFADLVKRNHLAVYRKKYFFTDFTHSVCLDIQNGKAKRQKPTPAEIKEAVARRF